jgi:hypothetical protein
VDGVEDRLLGSSSEPDLAKHYLLVQTVTPGGYAASLNIHPGDKVYGMSDEGDNKKMGTRVTNGQILQRIQDRITAANRDKEEEKKKNV